MSVPLKPCPFCGGEADRSQLVGDMPCFVGCLPCNLEGPFRETNAEAIAAWNRRAGESAARDAGLEQAAQHHEDRVAVLTLEAQRFADKGAKQRATQARQSAGKHKCFARDIRALHTEPTPCPATPPATPSSGGSGPGRDAGSDGGGARA